MILLTVSPQVAVELLNGHATALVRSWKVPLGTAYICCAKPKKKYRIGCMGFFSDELYRTPKGEIKFGSSVELMAYDDYDKSNFLSGKVVAKCEITKVYECGYDDENDDACVTGYVITLSSLSVLDKPMEVSQFYRKPFKDCKANCEELPCCSELRLTRLPSRWQEVEVGE